MRDSSHPRNGFSALSTFKDWLARLVINLNPPLRELARVEVRIGSSNHKEKRN